MTLSFQGSDITVALNDTEAFTQQKWSDLVASARRAKTPYYTAAVCTLKGNVTKVYDGIYLNRYLNENVKPRDPLTRQPILSVDYQFLKVANTARKNSHCFTRLALAHHSSLALEANNFHAHPKIQKLRAAKCQFVVGASLYRNSQNLIERAKSVRWLRLSALNGCLEAISFSRT